MKVVFTKDRTVLYKDYTSLANATNINNIYVLKVKLNYSK